MIVEFSSPLKSGNNIMSIASIHYKIFTAMQPLDSSLKTITQHGRIIEYPKDLSTGNEYKKNFQTQQKNLTDSNQKIFARHKIESALKLN